jgi:EmrB/QacA subfamily drug resistance transporter
MNKDNTKIENIRNVSSLRGVLTALCLSMLLSSLGTSSINVALPTLANVFNVSIREVQWVVLAYLLVITTLVINAGRLGDIVGRRRLLLAGLGLFTMASVLCSLASSFLMMIAARSLQGLGATTMMALTLAFVSETVPKEKTGSAMGLLGAMSAVGTALGPSLGGALIATLGWQAIFVINLPLGILAFILTYRCLPADRREQKIDKTGFDQIGTLVLVGTLAAYTLAMTIGNGNFGLTNVALLLTAILGVGLFVFVEKKVSSPLIRLSMLNNPLLSAGLGMSALVSTVLMTTLVVGPFYLSYALGLNVALIGVVMSIGPLVVAVSSVFAGRLVDRFGTQTMTIVGHIGIAAGTCILSITPMALGIPGYVVPVIIITLGYALFQTANNTAVMKDVRQDLRGVVSGMLNLSRNLGLITGASLMGAIFAFASGTSDIALAQPHAISVGMRITYGVATVLIILSTVMATMSHVWSVKLSSRIN